MTVKELKIQLALGSLSHSDKYDIAENTKSIKILKILSTDKNWYIRSTIARNPNTPKEVLKILSTDEDNTVRYFVAMNPNTPKEALRSIKKY